MARMLRSLPFVGARFADEEKTVWELIDEFRAALAARQYQQVRTILREYERTFDEVLKKLREVVRKIERAQADSKEVSLVWLYQEARLQSILEEIAARADAFGEYAVEFTATVAREGFELGAKEAVDLGKSVSGHFSGMNGNAFKATLGVFESGSPVREIFDSIGRLAAVKARDTFAKGIALGWNPRKLGKHLEREIEGLTRNRAVLIARTEQLRGYRAATQATYEQNRDVLRGWRWTCARTIATCPLCLAMDGEIFPVTETLSSHPACRCVMSPLPATEFPGYEEPQSGEDWFDGLSSADQDAILGKKKGSMFRDGEITLKDNVNRTVDPRYGQGLAARTIKDLQVRRRLGQLVSQGPGKLSSYDPPPAKKL